MSLFKRASTILFVLGMFVVVGLTRGSIQVQAQGSGQSNLSRHGFQVSIEDQQAYSAATANCDSPSLECLVRNVSRFTAIEWVNEIMGEKQLCQTDGTCDDTTDAGTGPNVTSRGAIGGLTLLMASMYSHPPATTGTYVADVLDSAHIVAPAYAQGLGYAALDPVLGLWKTFRNIAYMFFVILFIVIGFMIMFRQKVGAQTVITAQQAIPRIIVSLLFVTFSYAIAGLMIDIMYLLMFLILGIFGESFGPKADSVINRNIVTLGFDLIWQGQIVEGWGRNTDLISSSVYNLSGQSNAATTVVGFLGGIALTLILALAMLFSVIRLFFILLKAYAMVILRVVIGPLELMLGAMPGNNAAIVWIKNIAGNLIPFPTVLLIVVMYYHFTKGSIADQGAGFMPPFLLGGGQANALSTVMGLAIILALPDIVKHVQKPFVKEGGIGQTIATGGSKAFARGWRGGKLVPGVGFTDTRKLPWGGVSGANIMRKSAVIGGAGVGGVTGAAVRTVVPPRRPHVAAKDWSLRSGRWLSRITGEKQLFQGDKKGKGSSSGKGP